jgi:hypothetical protein
MNFLFEQENIKINFSQTADYNYGVQKIKQFLEFLIKEGVLFIGDYSQLTEEEKNKIKEKYNNFKKNFENQKKVAEILDLDYELLKKYNLNPFDCLKLSFYEDLILVHYSKSFFANVPTIIKKESESGKLTSEEIFNKFWTIPLKSARGIVFQVSKLQKETKADNIKEKENNITSSSVLLNLLAYAYEKFFNLNEIGVSEAKIERVLELADKYRYSISEKWDGALGIVFLYKNKPVITTKGSLVYQESEKNQQILDNLIEKDK